VYNALIGIGIEIRLQQLCTGVHDGYRSLTFVSTKIHSELQREYA
jgi:hypothetical protein